MGTVVIQSVCLVLEVLSFDSSSSLEVADRQKSRVARQSADIFSLTFFGTAAASNSRPIGNEFRSDGSAAATFLPSFLSVES